MLDNLIYNVWESLLHKEVVEDIRTQKYGVLGSDMQVWYLADALYLKYFSKE